MTDAFERHARARENTMSSCSAGASAAAQAFSNILEAGECMARLVASLSTHAHGSKAMLSASSLSDSYMNDDRYRSPKLAKIACSHPQRRRTSELRDSRPFRDTTHPHDDWFLITQRQREKQLTTMSLPRFSALRATLTAATAAAPDDIPT